MEQNSVKSQKAVIYCRVSSDRQAIEGNGLGSQETRCREYAKSKGYNVLKTFNDAGVSGRLLERPAFRDLIGFLGTQKEEVVVIIDHIDRLARDVDTHLDLRNRLRIAGGKLESPSFQFGDTPHEKFMENVVASVAQYQREHNALQVNARMKARLLAGFWPFPAPIGYRYTKAKQGGKLLEVDSSLGSLVAEAFEGFAVGRFASVMDVVRFMARDSRLPYNRKSCAHAQRVKEMFSRVLYTGQIEYLPWEVSLREGHHPAIISMQIFQKVQVRLGLRANAPTRKDLNQAFPLRGFLLCSECLEPVTASFSKGRTAKHPYYRCKTKGCSKTGKSLPRDKVEQEFEQLLHCMGPRSDVLDLARDMLASTWRAKKSEYTKRVVDLERQRKALDSKITDFMDQLLETEDREIRAVYHEHIRKLKHEAALLSSEAQQMGQVDTSFEGAVGTVFDFIGNPHSLWANGGFEDKRLVLKLAFARKLAYSKDRGFGTGAEALPFSMLAGLSGQKGKMVACAVYR